MKSTHSFKLGFSVLFLLSAAGCTTLTEIGNDIKSYKNPYVGPSEGERARVRFATDGLVRAIPGRDCIDWDAPNGGMVLDHHAKAFSLNDRSNHDKSLGMPDRYGVSLQTHLVTELHAKAGVPLLVDYHGPVIGGELGPRCTLTHYFLPEPNVDYEVSSYHISTDRSGRNLACHFTLSRLVQEGAVTKRIPVHATPTASCLRLNKVP